MKNSSKLTKDDLKWIKFNQKMAQMSGKKKTSKNFLDALKNAHNEVYFGDCAENKRRKKVSDHDRQNPI